MPCQKMTRGWLVPEMDQHVKRMLKLIEEDADSFAKKAEMYYQKRPELISLVEDFYKMYRSLAERYDHVTGELRRNVPSDLQSQSSGISDVGSEPPSTMPSPDRRPIQRKQSGPRAAGFDFFLGSGGSDLNSKEGDETSTLDSESDSDDSSVNNYSATNSHDEDQGLRRRIIELEVELRAVKEKLRVQDEELSEDSSDKPSDEIVMVNAKLATYKEELESAKRKIQLSQEEISQLTIELQKYKALGDSDGLLSVDVVKQTDETVEENQVRELQGDMGTEGEVIESIHEIQTFEEELKIAEEKLHESEIKVTSLQEELTRKDSSIENLQDQLKSAQKEVSVWKKKVDSEKREVSKLQDRMIRYKNNLSDRDQEIRGLKEAINNANKSLSEENEQLKEETTRLLKGRALLEDNIKEMDLRCQTLEEEVRRVTAGKVEMEVMLCAQIDQLKADIAEKDEALEELKKDLDELQMKYKMLAAEKDNLVTELGSKDDEIDEMSKHLHELHMQHVELITGAEGVRKMADDLVLRVKDLEREVERKEQIIVEGAEEKREAIRQLCFSLEHYRNGYHRLRQAFKSPVMAS